MWWDFSRSYNFRVSGGCRNSLVWVVVSSWIETTLVAGCCLHQYVLIRRVPTTHKRTRDLESNHSSHNFSLMELEQVVPKTLYRSRGCHKQKEVRGFFHPGHSGAMHLEEGGTGEGSKSEGWVWYKMTPPPPFFQSHCTAQHARHLVRIFFAAN